MKKIMAVIMGVCLLSLAGCNTFSGAGKDIKAGGNAISNAAENTKDSM